MIRIRRVRCDETRPSCTPCTKTGRVCDFVNPQETISSARASKPPATVKQRLLSSPKPCLIQPKLHFPPTVSLSTHEGNHLEYFRLLCTRSFSRYFENTLWDKTLLQIATSEPSIRNAVVALSFLFRHQTVQGEGHSAVTRQAITVNYLEAVKSLNLRLDTSRSSWELALLGSLVFAAFETLQSNQRMSLKHFNAGLAMLKDLKSRFHV